MLFAAVGVYFLSLNEKPEPVRQYGGETFTQKIEVQNFLQTDNRWKDEQLGNSGESLYGYGCTLCCTAMALNANGFNCNPLSLNNYLSANNGYTTNGYLIWNAVTNFTNKKVKVAISNAPTFDKIDAQLKKTIL